VAPPLDQRTCGLDLLRTCRQIYVETALLPYKSNTFSTSHYRCLEPLLQGLKKFQRKEIVTIQLAITPNAVEPDGWTVLYGFWALEAAELNTGFLKLLPALKRVHVLLLKSRKYRSPADSSKCIEKMRKQLLAMFAGKEVETEFELTDMMFDEYVSQYVKWTPHIRIK